MQTAQAWRAYRIRLLLLTRISRITSLASLHRYALRHTMQKLFAPTNCTISCDTLHHLKLLSSLPARNKLQNVPISFATAVRLPNRPHAVQFYCS
jgi:hypothetical protein